MLAKEAEDSQARLNRLREKSDRLNDRSDHGSRRKHKDREDEQRTRKRRKVEEDDEEGDRRRRHHRSNRDSHRSSKHDKDDREKKHRRHRRHHDSDEEDDDHKQQHSREIHRDRYELINYPAVSSRRGRKDDGTWRHIRFGSRSPSRSRSRDRNRQKKDSKRRRFASTSESRSPEPRRKRSYEHDASKALAKEENAASDSDPLEAIVGPMPKTQPQPKKIIFRGRGAFSTTSAMDSHFASNYDPIADVRPNSDEEDEWGLAIEAHRDRQKWKQQGAERLRAAGFTDEQVRKWEKGGEKTEDDVKWAKKGEGREWDRGKVVDDDGDVDVKAEWGRLKGT